MPPIFFTEIRNEKAEFRDNKPTGKNLTTVTRYYTEFQPDPADFLSKLEKSDWVGIETERRRLGEVIPKSITISPGNWDLRIDWTEVWELLDGIIETFDVLGLTLYNVTKELDLGGDRTNEIEFSSRVFKTDEDYVAHFQKLGRPLPSLQVQGKVVGKIRYEDLIDEIKADERVSALSLTYNDDTRTTTVQLTLEELDIGSESGGLQSIQLSL